MVFASWIADYSRIGYLPSFFLIALILLALYGQRDPWGKRSMEYTSKLMKEQRTRCVYRLYVKENISWLWQTVYVGVGMCFGW